MPGPGGGRRKSARRRQTARFVAAAQEHEADVICMGSTGPTGFIRVLMGSVTRHVLQDLPCSLLTVKDEHLIEEPFGIDTSTARSESAGSALEG